MDWACLAAWALSTWPFLAEANVIVLLSDSRQPRSIPHLGHTLPWWQDRSRWAGPEQEQWSCVWVPVDETTGLHRVHHTWGSVFAAEMLACLYPSVHLLIADHDSAPLTLFEAGQLLRFADLLLQMDDSLPGRGGTGLLLSSESRAEVKALCWSPGPALH